MKKNVFRELHNVLNEEEIKETIEESLEITEPKEKKTGKKKKKEV